MDWKEAIARKQRELSAIVAGLMAMLAAGALRDNRFRSDVLGVLRPAESAVRRLIVLVMRHGMNGAPIMRQRDVTTDFSGLTKSRKGVTAFCLIDARKRFEDRHHARKKADPHIWAFGTKRAPHDRSARPAPRFDAIERRLCALRGALEDLPGQARRMARMMARRQHAPSGRCRVGPVRPGLAPGFRARRGHRVDAILLDCHGLVAGGVWRPPRRERESPAI